MDIDEDTPLRLAVAVKLAFPNGGIGVSGLRKEAKRGRLTTERIAGKDFTTLRAIQEMRDLCRIPAKPNTVTLKAETVPAELLLRREAFKNRLRKQMDDLKAAEQTKRRDARQRREQNIHRRQAAKK